MKKNQKGFTMIELLAAIIILGVLLGIAIPGISNLMKQFRRDYYSKLEESITASAKEFYTDNKLYKPDGILHSSYTTLEALTKNKYVDEVVDYKGKTCSLTDSYVVIIYFGKDNYKYKTCLKCSNDKYVSDTKETYCDEAWKTNDNIKYQFSDKDRLYVYYNSPREEIRNELMSSLHIVKLNNEGTVLESVLAEDTQQNILPLNIDELDTTPELDKDNKKVNILRYKINDTEKTMEAVVYKYKAPRVTMTRLSDGSKYEKGTWANGITIRLDTDYSSNWNFYELTNTEVSHFQWYKDGKWENIKCDMSSSSSCTIAIKENQDKDYRFRIVTNKNQISDESSGYNIKIDMNKPVVKITPNGIEPIIKVGSEETKISFTLTTSDTGGSGIKSRKFVLSDSNKEYKDEELTSFNIDTYTYSKDYKGCKKYVWAIVEDNAGNKSEEVYPSNAFWTKYEIVYDVNGGTGNISTQYKYYGKTLKLTTTRPTRTGYKFVGWSTNKNAKSPTYTAGWIYNEEKAIKLYAVWQPNKIYVKYHLSGGKLSSNHPDIGTISNLITINSSNTIGTYNYDEYIGSNGLEDYNDTSRINIENAGFHAVAGAEWTNSQRTFSQETNYKANDLCDATQGDCTVVMYVNWEANKINVMYHVNGGSLASSGGANIGISGSYVTINGNLIHSTYNYGDNLGSGGLANYNNPGWINIQKTGYHGIDGAEWKNQDGKTFDHDKDYPAKDLCDATKGDCTAIMYVNWDINTITVRYHANGGSLDSQHSSAIALASSGYLTLYGNINQETYNYGESLSSGGLANYNNPDWINLKKIGYHAVVGAEWKNQDGRTFDHNMVYPAKDLCDATRGDCIATMYVNWTADSYTVKFNANGGSVSPSNTKANYGSSITLPTPTRDGYTFNGWYTAASGGGLVGKAGASYTVTYSTTLYAQWTQKAHTHNFNARSSNDRMRIVNKGNSTSWPWNTVGKDNYGCTATGHKNICIPDYQMTLGVFKAYYITCSICGAQEETYVWCPVHNTNEGKNIRICDATSKKYSSDATSCIGKTEGWTLVSK